MLDAKTKEEIKSWIHDFFYFQILDIEKDYEVLNKRLIKRIDNCSSIDEKLFLIENYPEFKYHEQWMDLNVNSYERKKIAKLLIEDINEKKQEIIAQQNTQQRNNILYNINNYDSNDSTQVKITGIGSKFSSEITKRIGEIFIRNGAIETTVNNFQLIFSNEEITEVQPIIFLYTYRGKGNKKALRDLLELISNIEGYDNKETKELISLFFQDKSRKKMYLNKKSGNSQYYIKFKIWIENAKKPDQKVYSIKD